jgi:hypothetical protein
VDVGCWAHARRKFFEARSSSPEEAEEALGLIRRLYRVEVEAKEFEPDERAAIRSRALRHDILYLPFEFSSPMAPLSPLQFLAGLAPRRTMRG